MKEKLIMLVEKDYIRTDLPEFKAGDTLNVSLKVTEGAKERIQRFKGVVIKTAGKSALEKTITVRRKVGAFAVEKIFAIHSPTIDKIEVLRTFKVRRKSIKYIRNLTGKAARLKEIRK